MAERNNNGELPQDFGKKLSLRQRDAIKRIKNNDPGCKYTRFQLIVDGDSHFTSDSEWTILGQYIAQNRYIRDATILICFSETVHNEYALTDSRMSAFFGELNGSAQLRSIKLAGCACSVSGFQSMAPFLNNSPQLKTLKFGWNVCINKQCFDELMRLMNGTSIEALEFENSWKLDDISALEQCTLHHLRFLNMHGCKLIQRIPSLNRFTNLKRLILFQNNIGVEGCADIAKMLQKNSPPLEYLSIEHNPISGEGVEMLANSLQSNTTMKNLSIDGEGVTLTESACLAFLKVLNDVTSIEMVCQSNHTLMNLCLPWKKITKEMQNIMVHVNSALQWNRFGRKEAIRKRVTQTLLSSKTRMKLCTLQGIDYCQSSIFAEIEPIILPEGLSLVGRMHWHNVLYQMLIAVVPGLVSVVDRQAVLEQNIAENLARIAAIEHENVQMRKELDDIKSKAQVQSKLSGKKRCR